MLIDYDRPVTWPLEVTTFLEANRAVLEDWLTDQRFASPHHYDAIIRDLSDVLLPHNILAWHNTRLTRREAAAIGANGMYLDQVHRPHGDKAPLVLPELDGAWANMTEISLPRSADPIRRSAS